MAKQSKVIISCAITGAIHTPTMSPHLPITPDEIAQASIEAAEAGASIIHLHARDPSDGKPTPDPDVFMEFLPRIKQNTDAVVNITTGGGLGMTVDERIAAAIVASPEVTSLNMGSMNFGIFAAAERDVFWKEAISMRCSRAFSKRKVGGHHVCLRIRFGSGANSSTDQETGGSVQ